MPAAIQGFRPELAGMVIEDVPDPYRRSQGDYDKAYAIIESACKDISAWVRGRGSSPGQKKTRPHMEGRVGETTVAQVAAGGLTEQDCGTGL